MFSDLTKRERQVLQLTAQGLRGAQIAIQLGISEQTIRKHRSSIMQKAGLRSTAQLIACANHGLGNERHAAAPLPWDRLCPREAEIVRHVVAGCTSKEIARLLDISPLTVQKHRERAREKLGVHTVGEMIRRGAVTLA
ncbi:helix-turn-helix transcriptional regulator [Niveispirillum sp. SYP-B3756]|uniref:helix-turn-helix domain-containing protein n=1 Tax=Niveispirillum sp. SYP-B3756 TaxID=2662178 RepID=UPI001292AB9F|nr:helix-turn-helix transcriptional regulator [Niveispirillum sp. SYP-B3756]MQP67213.1 helix-turn-helix transcriptional regulator [Niveispirillum sp. SYP-B3756]